MFRKILTAISAALSLIGAANAEELKPHLELTEVVTSKKPVHRVQTRLFGLPLDSNTYTVWEHKDSDYYKLRLESLPLKHKNLSLGLAAQYVDGTNFEAHEELGISLKIKGKPIEDSYALAKIRFFPETDTLSTYSFLETPKLKADLLGSYNIETTRTMLNPGIQYKINNIFYIGLETRLSGEIDNLKPIYSGIRIGAKFSK